MDEWICITGDLSQIEYDEFAAATTCVMRDAAIADHPVELGQLT
jgi:hypothetical protein